ncbi:MAG: hypothetical protein C0601_00890 [Candidatus Muiribacterium halophilum]|uniref:DUF4382 domain-containing protein n=1 Tax=Muiribacterium halophilum TaxID=2053465 RepID=A0A2N5ZMA1_MUIH1|nr:MAG: hypothetical protein C0601_00890 [Candidatus Muirbacterium halophilum]
MFRSGSRWMLITYIAVALVFSAMFFMSGCTSSDSTSVNPVNMYEAEGKLNLKVKTISETSVTYGHSPQFFVENEIPLKLLKKVGLFVSKINLVRDDGQTTTVYENSEMLSEPTFYLRDEYMNEDSVFVSDVTVPATTYVKAEIYVSRVWVVYKTSSTSEEASWDASSFNKTIVLNAYAPVTVKPGETVNLAAFFNIAGRIGTTSGNFYPYAYIDSY